MTTYYGKGVFPGIAFGFVHLLQKTTVEIEKVATLSQEQEWRRVVAAKAEADKQLETLFEKTKDELGEDEAMIIDVQRMMLEDGDFSEEIQRMIQDGCSAPYATFQAGQQFHAFFASLDDPYMQERATDVLDIAERLTDILLDRRKDLTLPADAVIVAEDLTPSETLQMDKTQIRAFVIRAGSTNSHTAILARTMNIPCLVQTNIPLDPAIDGKEVVVNGEDGVCILNPDKATSTDLQQRQEAERAQRKQLCELRGLETISQSGRVMKLYANIGGIEDLESVLENDAEGIGLLRSEFLYLGRTDYPSEDEQFEAYKTIVEGLGSKQVIIRTMDIGADKHVDYFQLDKEENPALGLRGIRICIDRPELFRTQLRAIYRASAFGSVAIMFPMITSLWEVRHCREQASVIRHELTEEGTPIGNVEIGIMIETPASVVIADTLAKEVDFFSVGTNDLTQYTLALDRQNSKLEQFYDPKHPAIMEMLRVIAECATKNGICAGICGELAADPVLTETFMDMGYAELSVSPSFILGMRKHVREMK